MRQNLAPKALQKIVDVRAAQKAAAENRLHQAAERQEQVQAEHDACSAGLAADLAHWLRLDGSASRDLTLLQAWAGEIARRRTQLDDLNRALSHAQAERQACADRWRAAEAQHGLAATFFDGQNRHAGRRREEAELVETTERFSREAFR